MHMLDCCSRFTHEGLGIALSSCSAQSSTMWQYKQEPYSYLEEEGNAKGIAMVLGAKRLRNILNRATLANPTNHFFLVTCQNQSRDLSPHLNYHCMSNLAFKMLITPALA